MAREHIASADCDAMVRLDRGHPGLMRLVFACLGMAALLLTAASASAAESKRVMLLYSFGRDFKPWSEYARTIRTELERQSPWPLDVIDHSLVTARLGDAATEAAFVDYLRNLYANQPPDLIVSLGAPAASFVQQYRQKLFPETPMVLTAVEQRRVKLSPLGTNDAVVAVHINYLAAMENILKVLPDTKNVAVVVGTSPIEQFWRAEIEKEVKPLAGRLAFTWYDDLSFENILKQAATLPPHSAIFWELMLVDAAGVVHEGGTALARLHAVANAPIFSYDDSFFGREIVGGPLLSVPEGSRETAAAAIRILAGEKPGDMKIPPIEFSAPKFDWREMQRWGISVASLPPGSEILFREPGNWERHQREIIAILTVIVLQAALITWLFYEQRKRRRSEAEAHAMSRRLIHAQEEERARLARELHDDVTQRLAALAINAASQSGKSLPADTRTAMTSLHEGLVRLGEDVHALSYRLHPAILTDLGLVEALRSECDSFAQSPIQVELNTQDVPDDLPQDIGLCLYRITQESLRNVARHSGASRAEVRLLRTGGGLQLAVRDNGAGFDPRQRREGMNLGLASMRERVAALGGRLDIQSSPGLGTTVLAWIPLRSQDGSEPAGDEARHQSGDGI